MVESIPSNAQTSSYPITATEKILYADAELLPWVSVLHVKSKT